MTSDSSRSGWMGFGRQSVPGPVTTAEYRSLLTLWNRLTSEERLELVRCPETEVARLNDIGGRAYPLDL